MANPEQQDRTALPYKQTQLRRHNVTSPSLATAPLLVTLRTGAVVGRDLTPAHLTRAWVPVQVSGSCRPVPAALAAVLATASGSGSARPGS